MEKEQEEVCLLDGLIVLVIIEIEAIKWKKIIKIFKLIVPVEVIVVVIRILVVNILVTNIYVMLLIIVIKKEIFIWCVVLIETM